MVSIDDEVPLFFFASYENPTRVPEQQTVRERKKKMHLATTLAIKMGWYFWILEKTQLDFVRDLCKDSVLKRT